jgi:hypothetical protein
MERYIAGLVKDFERGRIDRRQFCEGVALAATVFAAGNAARAAPAQGLKMLGVNHISYACSDYRVARDWYTKVLNLKAYNDKGMGRANLAFGPAPDARVVSAGQRGLRAGSRAVAPDRCLRQRAHVRLSRPRTVHQHGAPRHDRHSMRRAIRLGR